MRAFLSMIIDQYYHVLSEYDRFKFRLWGVFSLMRSHNNLYAAVIKPYEGAIYSTHTSMCSIATHDDFMMPPCIWRRTSMPSCRWSSCSVLRASPLLCFRFGWRSSRFYFWQNTQQLCGTRTSPHVCAYVYIIFVHIWCGSKICAVVRRSDKTDHRHRVGLCAVFGSCHIVQYIHKSVIVRICFGWRIQQNKTREWALIIPGLCWLTHYGRHVSACLWVLVCVLIMLLR